MAKDLKQQGQKRWEILAQLLPSDKKIKLMEVGVWKGIMTVRLLKLMPNLEWYGVDNWRVPKPGSANAKSSKDLSQKSQREFDSALACVKSISAKYKGRCHIYVADSAEIAANFKDGEFDCVFIDADHSYEGCRRDILAWRNKVKPGGIFSGHDYANNEGEVKRVVDELIGSVELYDDHVWVKRV